MGQRPGFTVKEQAPAFPGSERKNEITIEVRVWAPHDTDRQVILDLLNDVDDRVNINIAQTWARKEGN